MPIEHVYGIDYEIPSPPPFSEMGNFRFQEKEQYFRRIELPSSFDQLEFDEDGYAVYSEEQEKFIDREFERVRYGYWFLNNGEATYITGTHYFYLNYWTLEDGNRPDYRDADRRYFYYQDYWEKINWCLGIIRIKKRREGATSQATASLTLTAITCAKARCGIISKTGPDAKKAFQEMIKPGFRSLPEFWKPDVADPDPSTEYEFRKKLAKTTKRVKEKGQVFDTDRGLESSISYRNTAMNSYDSGRLTRLLLDEGGKFPTEVPINKYWPIVKKTLVKGAIKVGFALIPSTVNDAEHGGKGFKAMWDESRFSGDVNTPTASGLVPYFSPAYEGFEGFIDRHGMSIIDTPTKDQVEYIRDKTGITIDCGAKEFLLRQRSAIKDPEALNEEIRMNPFTEKEAFLIDESKCWFSAHILEQVKEKLEEKEPVKRRASFYEQYPGGPVLFRDDPHGLWELLEIPEMHERNSVIEDMYGRKKPGNTHKFCSGVDPFRSNQKSGMGSKGVIWIGKKLDLSRPDESCKPVARYIGRPSLVKDFNKEVYMACKFFGCMASFERDAGDSFYEHFQEWGALMYLAAAPDIAIRSDVKLTEAKKKLKGVQSGDAFHLSAMLEATRAFVDSHGHKIAWLSLVIQMLEEYDHTDREKYDETCAFMVLCAYMIGSSKPQTQEKPKTFKVLKKFSLKVR